MDDGRMDDGRLSRQLAFLIEGDKLKSIIRRTPLADSSRLENSAEHSWHLSLAALALGEYAPAGVDRLRTLWEEFEAQETPAARFANALDRLQALLQNVHAGGGSWVEHRVTRSQVLGRMAPVESALPALWPVVLDVVDRFFGPK